MYFVGMIQFKVEYYYQFKNYICLRLGFSKFSFILIDFNVIVVFNIFINIVDIDVVYIVVDIVGIDDVGVIVVFI